VCDRARALLPDLLELFFLNTPRQSVFPAVTFSWTWRARFMKVFYMLDIIPTRRSARHKSFARRLRAIPTARLVHRSLPFVLSRNSTTGYARSSFMLLLSCTALFVLAETVGRCRVPKRWFSHVRAVFTVSRPSLDVLGRRLLSPRHFLRVALRGNMILTR
jgi:hypothetical protein